MSKGTQLWPGDRMRAFFRAHIRRETLLPTADADRLAEALTKSVNRMLVWDEPSEPPVAQQAAGAAAPSSVPSPQPSAAPFNPYIFSALVLLAKKGREGLHRRLTEIKSADNLRALADAQHLAIEPTLRRTEDIRKAIVAATEKRLADRKAAAS